MTAEGWLLVTLFFTGPATAMDIDIDP